MDGPSPMQVLLRDAFLASDPRYHDKPIVEIAAYLEILIEVPEDVDFISVGRLGEIPKWRVLLFAGDRVITGRFGKLDDSKDRFSADLRVEPISALKSFSIGPSSTAVVGGSGRAARVDPEVVVGFGDWNVISIGERSDFNWGFPKRVGDSEDAKLRLIRRLLEVYLTAR